MNITVSAHHFEQLAAFLDTAAATVSLIETRALGSLKAVADQRNAYASFIAAVCAELSPEARARLSTAFSSYVVANDTFKARQADVQATKAAKDTETAEPLRALARSIRDDLARARAANATAAAATT